MPTIIDLHYIVYQRLLFFTLFDRFDNCKNISPSSSLSLYYFGYEHMYFFFSFPPFDFFFFFDFFVSCWTIQLELDRILFVPYLDLDRYFSAFVSVSRSAVAFLSFLITTIYYTIILFYLSTSYISSVQLFYVEEGTFVES